MANVGLAPFMCYSHPNGLESLLKHTSIICWSDGHIAMLITGTLLLLFCMAFLAFCFVAACKGPTWSVQGQTAISFLVDDFRPNLSWFGLVALSRGVLLSLPPVIAPNFPNLQLILLHSVMLASLFFQGMFCPFKAPALNVIDATTQLLFLSIICIGLGGLEQTEQGTEVLELFGALLIIQILMMFALFLLIFTMALLLDKVSGRHGDFGRRCANLGGVPSGKVLFFLFRELVSSMKKFMRSPQRDTIIQTLERLGPHDAHMLLTSFLILQSEVGVAQSMNATRGSVESNYSNMSNVSQLSHWSSGQARIAYAPSALARRSVINFAMSKMIKRDDELELDMDEKALGRGSRLSFASSEIEVDAEESSDESREDAGDLTRHGKVCEDQVDSLKLESGQGLESDADEMVSFYA